MRTAESFTVALRGISSNKLRAGLTMLGILFGVAAVIAMVSIGEGAKEETLKQIELLGTNNIIINAIKIQNKSAMQKASFSPGLTLKDAQSIKEINAFTDFITPSRQYSLQVTYGSTISSFNIVGTTKDYPTTFNTNMVEGFFFDDFHFVNKSNVCVIASGVKEAFFKFETPIGKQIKINDVWFDIIGVASPKNITSGGGKSIGLHNLNNDIYIPLTSMFSKLENTEALNEKKNSNNRNNQETGIRVADKTSVDQLAVKIKNADDMKESSILINRILERRHYGVADYELILPEELLEQKQKTQKIFNVVMGAIAGISLLVGGIGIMNIMLANILERTREIGVRRAVGATKNDILSQFMFEAVTISLIGGVAGIITGFLLTRLISTYAGWATVISFSAIFFAFVVSVAIGVIFGIYPAKKAAEKNPIESLRYE